MTFAQPFWLLAGAAACALLLWRYRRFDQTQRRALAQFAAPRLLEKLTASVSPARRRCKRILLVAGVACLFVALARPQAGYRWEETHRKGLELLFAVDVSKSMLAQDVKPNRLTRAKLAVQDLLNQLDGDGVGLIAFAGNSFLQCPVTLDYDAFRESLDTLDTSVIPRGGTDIASAIREAQATFKTRTAAEKILVLMTDGEDLGGEGIAAAEDAAKNGVKIFTVGVGSASGELVPVAGESEMEFAKDASGQFVKSKLDEATLKKIAEATGGMYQPLGQQGEGLAAIYRDGLAQFIRHALASRRAKTPLEQFRWPLLAALLFFASEMLLGTRRRMRRAAVPTIPRVGRVRASALAIACMAAPLITQAASPQSAEKAYEGGNFARAQEDYAAAAKKNPSKSELQFNLGSSAYKAGDIAKAAEAFRNSLKTDKIPVQQSAYYNLGNTLYRAGQQTAQANPQETIKTWEKAVQSYDAALEIQADDADAKFNRDLVQKKLEQLKEQQKQQEQQKKDQQQEQNKQEQEQQQEKNQSGGEEQKDNADSNKGEPKDQKSQGSGDEKKDQPKDSPEQNRDAGSQNKEQKSEQPAAQNQSKSKPDQASEESGKSAPQPKPEEPQRPISKGQPEAARASDPKPGDTEATPIERREPGQMTREEAKALLDSLKNGDRQLPAVQQSRGTPQPRNDEPLKDW